jgi:hypothetical protein
MTDTPAPVTPRTEAGRRLLDLLYNEDEEASFTDQQVMDGVVAIEDAMYDRASNEGYHSGIADCKEHDPAHEREAAAPAATEALRAALAALLDHHDNTCRVSGGPGSECIVRDEARAVLRAALASPEPTPEPEHDMRLRTNGSRPFIDVLRSALERTLANFEAVLARRPVRDATETIAEARAALAEGSVAGSDSIPGTDQ